ncbi:MAG TPA: VOC family protein [Chloroflexota bacterium]|jgi:uncharacterized glyoxalase superfamily protein PhnB|nr:VOC family protein [Chloroflexota bacterium]
MDETQRPVVNQVNLIARDWHASLAFYRLLGIAVTDGDEFPPASGARHSDATFSPHKVMLEWDSQAMARQYTPAAAADAPVRGPILGLAYPSADAVDQAYQRVTSAGHATVQAPYDAFWGARYAIVRDPDGVAVGLMGPIDRSRGYIPGRPPG